MIFEYKPGMDVTRPWPFTVTRALPGYQTLENGTLSRVAANVLRDSHYINGVRTTLFEPSAINSCLQSQTFNTTWVPQESSVSANFEFAPDGTLTADKNVENSAVTVAHYIVQSGITITADEWIAASIYVKSQQRFRGRFLIYDTIGGQASSQVTMTFRLDTGTITTSGFSGTGVLGAARMIQLANGWWRLELTGKLMGSLTNLGIIIAMHDASGNEAYTGDGSSGWLLWGAQVERNGTASNGKKDPTSYIPTTTAASSARGGDLATAPWPHKVQPMWCYTSFYDLGMCEKLDSQGILTLTTNPATDPEWIAVFGGANGDMRSSWISGVGAGGIAGTNRNTVTTSGFAPVWGDFVEAFTRVGPGGETRISARKNGGSIVSGGPVGPSITVPFVDFLTPTLVCLGNIGPISGPLIGLAHIKMGSDPDRITTLDQALAQ